MDFIAQRMKEVLWDLAEAGFKFPIQFVTVGLNGAVLCGAYNLNEEGLAIPTFTAQHLPGERMTLPINIMFIDAKGQAAHFSVTRAEQTNFAVQ